VPVFRYALELWPASPYRLYVFHDTPLSDEQTTLLDQFREQATHANIVAETVSVNDIQDPHAAELWARETDAELPHLVMAYPLEAALRSTLWAAPFSDESLAAILDSPARQEVAKRLLEGESAVWVLIECGDADRDQAAWNTMTEQIGIQQDTLTLPDESDPDLPDIDETKLRLAFSGLRVSRDDPKEAGFVNMLLGTEPDLHSLDGPIAFPMYGRGRALYALVDQGINAEMIHEACAFVVGPCSCQVKDENPGTDMLFAMDWDNNFETLLGDNPLPDAIPSASTMQVADVGDDGAPMAEGSAVEASTAESDDAEATVVGADGAKPLYSNLFIALAIGIAVIGGGSLFMTLRKPSGD
jgi:hypothetical protein